MRNTLLESCKAVALAQNTLHDVREAGTERVNADAYAAYLEVQAAQHRVRQIACSNERMIESE